MSLDSRGDDVISGADPAQALEQTLLPAAYARLRAIAAGQRRRMPVATLNTTALVNEAFLRIYSTHASAERERYFALFARVVRNTMIVQVVEMRFFAGFENQEIAELLGLTEKTVRRDWLQARALLSEVLDDE